MTAESSDSPYFLGVAAYGTATAPPHNLPDNGRPLWEGTTGFKTLGEWPEEELRTVTTALGSVAVIGHCLANDEDLHNTALQALCNNDAVQLTHLPGNYTTIIEQPESTSIMADLAGRRPIFMARHNGQVLVSSQATALAETTGAVADANQLMARIACPFVPELTNGRSHWQDIEALEGGQRLTIDAIGATVDVYDSLAPDSGATFEEAAGALCEALNIAVSRRAAQTLRKTTDFSGGFDSSSLGILTAGYLPEGEPLQGFIFYNSSHQASEGDIGHARRIAGSSSRIDLHEIDTAGHIPYQGLLDLPFRDAPDPGGLMPGGRERAYFRAIQQSGGQLHISGGSGDSVLVPDSSYLADIANYRGISRFIQDGLATARLNDVSPLEVWARSIRLGHSGVRTAFAVFANGIEKTGARTPDTLWGESKWLALDWLTPEARKQLSEFARQRASDLSLPDGLGIGDYYSLSMLRDEARSYDRVDKRAREYGLSFHTPFLDHQVIRACRLLPAWKQNDPREFKSLLVSALSGQVPTEVFERQTKGDYTSDLYLGIRTAMPQLIQLLSDSVLGDLGIIEPKKVLRVLECMSTEKFSIAALNELVATELWLRRLNSYQLPPPLARNRPAAVSTQKGNLEKQRIESETSGKFYTFSPNVYAAAAKDGSLIFLSENRRNYSTTSPTAGRFLQALNAQSGNIGSAMTYLQRIYPGISTDTLRTDFMKFVTKAVGEGLLTVSGSPMTNIIAKQGSNKAHRPSNEVLAAWNRDETETPLKIQDVAITVGAFAVALTLKRLPFRWSPKLLHSLHVLWATRDATNEEAAQAFATTHSVTRWHLGRVACLEESLTSAVALALRRRRVAWCVGAAFDPARPHAWIEVDGSPIGTGKQLDYVPFMSTRNLQPKNP
jgi:asparagine synthase (glutamine-hydrolysing)